MPDPQSAAMVHAANSLVALGRARGLRIMLLTQRPAKLHKDALTQVETLVTMRLVAPQDRKAVEQWIVDQADRRQGAEIVGSLPTLKQGEAWVWSPDAGILWRAGFPAIATFDSMRPEAQGARELAPVDVAAIRVALAPVAAAAPDETGRAARTGEDRPPSAADIAAAERRGFERGYGEGEFAERQRFRYAIAREIEGTACAADDVAKRLRGLLTFIDRPTGAPAADASDAATAPVPAAKADAPRQDADGASLTDSLTPARQRILDAIAWANATGQAACRPEPRRRRARRISRPSMRAHGLSEDELLMTEAAVNEPSSRANWRWTIVGAIQDATNTAAVWGDGIFTFIGRAPGPEIAAYLRDLCVRAVENEAERFKAGAFYRRRRLPKTRRAATADFVNGMANGLASRIRILFWEMRDPSARRAADQVLSERYPRLKEATRGERKDRFDDAARAGRDASDRVRLDRGVADGGRAPAGLIGRST